MASNVACIHLPVMEHLHSLRTYRKTHCGAITLATNRKKLTFDIMTAATYRLL